MQSRFAQFWLLAAIVLTSVPLHAADRDRYTIVTGTYEVQINFTASDRQGQVVETLHPSDVAVVDNGWIVRQFRSFRRTTEGPLNLVILIDTSDSMELWIPDEIAEVKNFVEDTAGKVQDRVSVLSFGGMEPRLICAGNCNGGAAEAQLDALRANGMTPLYDAIVAGLEVLKDESDPESRSAMVLFTDGIDSISMHSLQEALQTAQDLQAAIYTVTPGSAGSFPSRENPVLDFLAVNTGGLSFRLGKDVAEILREIRDDLHSGYVLTYELPGRPMGWHKVRVLPTCDPKLQFRSRQAYKDMEEH